MFSAFLLVIVGVCRATLREQEIQLTEELIELLEQKISLLRAAQTSDQTMSDTQLDYFLYQEASRQEEKLQPASM